MARGQLLWCVEAGCQSFLLARLSQLSQKSEILQLHETNEHLFLSLCPHNMITGISVQVLDVSPGSCQRCMPANEPAAGSVEFSRS